MHKVAKLHLGLRDTRNGDANEKYHDGVLTYGAATLGLVERPNPR
jgi:hypothetical protein